MAHHFTYEDHLPLFVPSCNEGPFPVSIKFVYSMYNTKEGNLRKLPLFTNLFICETFLYFPLPGINFGS